MEQNHKMSLRPLDSRTKPNTSFKDLPLEMMAEIFQNLDPVERQKIRSVSRSWRDAISKVFVIELHIDKSNVETMLNTESNAISVVIPDVSQKLDTRFKQIDSFCSKLRKVEFRGIMLPDNFFLITARCEALKKLCLNKVIPTTLFEVPNRSTRGREFPGPSTDSSHPNWFPKLTSLRIISSYRTEKTKKHRSLFQVLACMLANGKLSKLYIQSSSQLVYEIFYNTMINALVEGRPEDIPMHAQNNCDYSYSLRNIIISNISTLRSLSMEMGVGYCYNNARIAFQLQPNGPAKLRVERLTVDVKAYWVYISLALWLRMMCQEDGLINLDLRFNHEQAFQCADADRVAEGAVQLTSNCIQKHSASLTSVSLCWCDRIRSYTNPAIRYMEVLSNCTNLISLTLMESRPLYHRFLGDESIIVLPVTAISQLPSSLKYLCTNLSFATETSGIDELEVPNLKNLETFFWSAHPWFIYNGTQSNPMSVSDFEMLKVKLPALQTLQLKLGDYRNTNLATAGTIGRTSTYIKQTVTSELLQMFEGNVVEQADFPYLKIHFPA